MTIDISRFELRVVQYDPNNPKLGIWDKQKEKFTGDYTYHVTDGLALLKKAIEGTRELVWRKTGEKIHFYEMQTFNHDKNSWSSSPCTSKTELNKIAKIHGREIRIIRTVEEQYVCELESKKE